MALAKRDVSLRPQHILGSTTTGGVLDVTDQFGALAAFDDNTKIEKLPEVVYIRLEHIQRLQDEYDATRQRHLAELQELEKKYQNMYTPILAKRCDIISGRVDPALTKKAANAMERIEAAMAAEAEAARQREFMSAKMNKPPETDTESEAGGDSESKLVDRRPSPNRTQLRVTDADGSEELMSTSKQVLGIPGFWLQAMKNHPEISQIVFPTDEDALKYLVDVRFEYLKQMKGFRLVFHFAKNPYFLNSEITKEYYVQNLFIGERYLEKMGGTEIHWKRGKDLTVKRVKRKTKRGKSVIRIEKADSFFHFFYDPQVTSVADEEDEEEVYQHIDADFETGLTFKDKACDSDDDEEKVPDEEDEYEAPLEQEASAMFGDDAAPSRRSSRRGSVLSSKAGSSRGGRATAAITEDGDEVDEGVPGEDVPPEDFPDDGADIRNALTEAFVAKTKLQSGVLATGSGTEAALLNTEQVGAVEKPDDCKAQ